MIFQRFLQILAFFVLILSGISAPIVYAKEVRPLQPEASSHFKIKELAVGHDFMVVTAHPDATRVAYQILEKGGTAADAGVAAQMVLGLVEPQSSGLGGGGFALYYDAANNNLISLDGRETAPRAVGHHLFMGRDGKPLDFYAASLGGRAVGVPGLLRLLEKVHNDYGSMPWPNLLAPAIVMAEEGFVVSERLSMMLRDEVQRFNIDTPTKLYFFPDGRYPVLPYQKLQNEEYAQTLRMIAAEGVDTFYKGGIGQDVIKKIRGIKNNPSLMSSEDLESYKVVQRDPVCSAYRGYKICSMGEPSSGGLTLLIALGILEQFDLPKMGADSPASWHAIIEASRLAFADRNQYMADSDFVKTPGTQLLNKDYLKSRATLIKDNQAIEKVKPGIPPDWDLSDMRAKDDRVKNTGTTHISIRDRYGNILSMTTSVENAFGSHVMSNGFLLNNQLTDFAFSPLDEIGVPKANMVEGGKRPRSSMSPVIVFDAQEKPVLIIGSAGGSRIIGYVLQRIISVLDWNIPIDKAMIMPSIVSRGQGVEIEVSADKRYDQFFESYGHPVKRQEMNSGLTAIQINGEIIKGFADPRRDGMAIGD